MRVSPFGTVLLAVGVAIATACGTNESPACGPTEPVCDEGPGGQDPTPLTVMTVDPPDGSTGVDLDVSVGRVVTLDGSGSTGTGAALTWTQIAGADVGALNGQAPSFTAPAVVETLAFELSVSDGSNTEVDTVRVWTLEDGEYALWVSVAGSDSNPGTRDAPFATIQAAIDAADNAGRGADVYVAAGNYGWKACRSSHLMRPIQRRARSSCSSTTATASRSAGIS